MNFKNTLTRTGIGLVALFLVLTLASGAIMAAFVSTGDLTADGTDAITGFSAETGQNNTIQYDTSITSDTLNDFDTLKLEVTHDNVTHVTYAQEDATVASGGSDSTTPLTVEFTVENDDLSTLPGEPGEMTNTTFEVTEVDTSGTEANDTAEVAYEFGNNRNVMYPADGTTDSSALSSQDAETGILGSIASTVMSLNPFSDDDSDDSGPDTHHLESDRKIAGNQTEIVVHHATDDMDSTFSDAAEGDSIGDPVLGQTVTVDGEVVPVFHSERDDSVVTSNDTYAIYDGTKTVIHLADSYSSSDSPVTVHVGSHNALHEDLDVEFSDVDEAYGGLSGSQIRGEFGYWTYIKTLP